MNAPITLIDTHAHVQFAAYDEDRAETLARARAAGVEAIVLVGTDPAANSAAIALAERHDWLYASVGIHPHDAANFGPDRRELQAQAAHPRVVALGEMGLDYYRMLAPRPAQFAAFEAQLELAAELLLPVVIHARQAADDALAVLTRWAATSPDRPDAAPLGVLHCFEGDLNLALRYVEMGFFISIPGPVTYPNAAERRAVASGLPLETMVVETDCPYLTPQRHRGQRNEPAYLAETVQEIAKLRNEPVETIASATTANARRLFALSPSTAAERAQ